MFRKDKSEVIGDFLEFLEDKLKSYVRIPSLDSDETKEQIKGYIRLIIDSVNIPQLIKEAIKEATKDLVVKNAIVEDVHVTNAIIHNETKVIPVIKEEIKIIEKNYDPSEEIKRLTQSTILKVFDELNVPKIIKEQLINGTKEVEVIQPKFIPKEVEQPVYKIREVIDPKLVPKTILDPVLREVVIRVKKVVLPDGREIL